MFLCINLLMREQTCSKCFKLSCVRVSGLSGYQDERLYLGRRQQVIPHTCGKDNCISELGQNDCQQLIVQMQAGPRATAMHYPVVATCMRH
jgi:hypothetical protein